MSFGSGCLEVDREVWMSLQYESLRFERAYRLDLLVEDLVVVELKVVEFLHRAHFAQVSTYLKVARKRVGLLINFNPVPLSEGIRRVVR